MPDSLANLDFSKLNLDRPTLNAIEQLLKDIELLIHSEQKSEQLNYLYKLQNDLVQIKGQKKKQGSKMVAADVRGLKNAFNAHKAASQQTQGISSYLLLFYAAECGMKCVWLKQNNLRTTNDIADSTLLSPDGHNLNRWKKELRISASIGNAPAFSLAFSGADLEVAKAHQVWRYGIGMNPAKEQQLVEWLKKIYNWIKKEI
ncbi:hypothetical protein Q5692_17515 [Microcoleus sp. C2C3]|uniref:hypothetical protein n=1 Tax=unclassified Microcoleus TaxID=2642155 RepID=UPI002FD29F91